MINTHAISKWFQKHAMRLALIGCFSTLSLSLVTSTQAQDIRHHRQTAELPPGQIGHDRLARGGPVYGFFQPVEVLAPRGANISIPMENGFTSVESARAKAGLLVGQVYQFKISQIPGHEGFELFPTVEVIDRLYPPVGQETNFPIPVHITAEEIESALDGDFIVRVIYLESPDLALPVRQKPDDAQILEVGPTEDPLHAADRLGRPMAILRLGSRVPMESDFNGIPNQMSPPLQPID